jgi:hypothetical protein
MDGIVPFSFAPQHKTYLDHQTALLFPALEAWLPEDLDRELLKLETGDWRFQCLPPIRMLRLELLQACAPEKSFQGTLDHAWLVWRMAGLATATPPSSSALAQARQRGPAWALQTLFRHTAALCDSGHRHPLCPEYRLRAIDGVPLLMPRSPANLAHFGTTHSQHGEAYWPQATAVWLTDLCAHHVCAEWLGVAKDCEQTVAPDLLTQHLQADDLVLGDAHFGSFPIQAVVHARRAAYLFRAYSTFKPELHLVERYGPQETLLHVRPTATIQKDYPSARWPEYLPVRAFQVEIPARDRLNGTETALFLTNLPRAAFPLARLRTLTPLRWNQETIHNDVKTRLGLGEIRSQTPAGVHKEIWAHLSCANLLRLLLRNGGGEPLPHSSFTAALRALREANQHLRLPTVSPAHLAAVVGEFIRRRLLPVRPDRSEPRLKRPSLRPFATFKTPRSAWRAARAAG